MVAGHDLDRRAEHLAAEILDRIWAASTEPLLPISAYKLDMSLSTSSLTTPSETCADAAPQQRALVASASQRSVLWFSPYFEPKYCAQNRR
jgi:hypothetical protein